MPTSADHESFLQEAIRLAVESVGQGGGPFGALVVREGEVIARAANRVTQANDPTAHAEVQAIRAACAALSTFRLDGCTLYASCEPCPMCLGAIYWARLERVVYAATHEEAARAGFSDEMIYRELKRPPDERRLPMQQQLADEGARPFETWAAAENRTEY